MTPEREIWLDAASKSLARRWVAYRYGRPVLPQRHWRFRAACALRPSQDQRIDQAEAIAEGLVQHGYRRIGIDHFAKPGDSLVRAAGSGRLHRNFQGYTDDASRVLLGLGASSISTFMDGFVQNVADVPRYVSAIEAGSLASARGCRLD
jgi:oxygen-independent coproporphyrinogen III oxidase